MVLKPSEFSAVQRHHLGRGDATKPASLRRCSISSTERGLKSVRRSLLHPDVDMVSFTGSTRAGTEVARLAGTNSEARAPGLGGKSPTSCWMTLPSRRPSKASVRARVPEYRAVMHTPPRASWYRASPGRSGGARETVATGHLWRRHRETRPRSAGGTQISFEVSKAYISQGYRRRAQSSSGGGRPPAWPRATMCADDFFQRQQRHGHRPRGDLRAGVGYPSLRDEEEAIKIAERHSLRPCCLHLDRLISSTPPCCRRSALADVTSQSARQVI